MSKKFETNQPMVYVVGGAVMSLVPKQLVDDISVSVKQLANIKPLRIFTFDK